MRGRTFWSGIGVAAMFVVLMAMCTTSVNAQSQAGTGQIVGTVYDAQGALVAGATVKLENKALAITREAKAGDEGDYRFILLPPGKYTVIVTATGFKTYKAEVEVTVGAAVTVNATLAVGEITQVVEVSATAAVETTVATEDALISEKAITDLPINGRRFHDFVTLTPTVQIEAQRNGISFAGQRGINGNVTIDGADYNEPFFGGMRGGERANNAFSIPQEAISQFQVVSYGYSVEFGRSTGGVMNAVTKSGSNELHGSAFYFNRNSEFGRRDAFNRKVLDTLQQVGGAFGGPLFRDRTFFFVSGEYQKNDNPRVVIFRRLDGFTPPVVSPGVPVEGACFYRAFAGCPSGSGQEADFTQTNDAYTVLGRVDQQFGSNHRASARYHYSTNTGKNAVATGDAIFPETNRALSNNGTEGDRTHTVTGQWTAIWSPRTVMETRATYSKEARPRTANTRLAGISTAIGTIGTRDFLPTTLNDYRVQVASNLTWAVGSHSLKFGGEVNHLHAEQFFKFNQFGIFNIGASGTTAVSNTTILNVMSVGSTGTGDPANRFDTNGTPAGTSVTYRVNIGNGLLGASMQELAFFIQDTWRITPRVTLTAGFRWEGYFNPSPDVSNTALYNSVKNFAFPIGLTTDPAIIPNNLQQFMPRAGLAWDPWGNGKTVIRANAGIFYARTPLLLFAAPLNNFRTPAGDLSVQLPLSLPTGFFCTPLAAGDTCNNVYWQMRRIGIDLNTVSLNSLPTLTPQDIQNIATALGLTVDPNRGAAPITWANNYEAPRSWQWGVGIEREISNGWSLGLDYVYINTVHLQRNRDYNLPTPLICVGTPLPTGCLSADLSLRPCFGVAGTTACGSSASRRARPIPTLDSVQVRESNARAFYQATTLRTNFRRGRYQLQAYYTLGYNYSSDDNERSAGGQDAVNAFALNEEYGHNRLDVRHNLVLNGIVRLPAGFQVSGLGRWRSSRPIDPTVSGDTNGDNFFNDRAFQLAGVPFPRNSFRDRAVYNTDIRIAWDAFTLLGKAFTLREGMRLQITADFFNIFNYDNVVYTSGASSGSNRNYGAGVSSSTGLPVAPNASFQRLRVSTACLSPTNPNGNKNCYDTANSPGLPFLMQLGVRFEF